ncbi:MAG: hypothetical protein HZB14_09570 [Actinobacteria bacterium]|nr:hypothetical protein [Actinomycetota bacterium]
MRASSTARAMRAMACLVAIAALAIAGCGGDGDTDAPATGVEAIKAANDVDKSAFPQADGKKTIEQISKEAGALPSDRTALTPATNNFVSGRVNRVPFGLFDIDRTPLWGPTVMYVSTGAGQPAEGPFVVAANALDVPEKYRSETSGADYETIGSGFYTALFNAGKDVDKVSLMTLTKVGDEVRSAITGLRLAKDDPTPAPGERAPSIKTDTLDDVDTSAEEVCTREPADDMHDISLDKALGKGKPVVLIFSTPALCSSRVCGPVNDVATEVQAQVGDRAIFIHQEIFKNNDPTAGYRPQVLKYGITSEPYTFVIDGDDKVATQLAGPFAAQELRAALDAAGLE